MKISSQDFFSILSELNKDVSCQTLDDDPYKIAKVEMIAGSARYADRETSSLGR